VVSGNCKEMCYEGVDWIGVAHDQIWKCILETCHNPGDKNIDVFQNDTDGIKYQFLYFWHEGTNFSRD